MLENCSRVNKVKQKTSIALITAWVSSRSSMAPVGQNTEHCPQRMHSVFLRSSPLVVVTYCAPISSTLGSKMPMPWRSEQARTQRVQAMQRLVSRIKGVELSTEAVASQSKTRSISPESWRGVTCNFDSGANTCLRAVPALAFTASESVMMCILGFTFGEQDSLNIPLSHSVT